MIFFKFILQPIIKKLNDLIQYHLLARMLPCERQCVGGSRAGVSGENLLPHPFTLNRSRTGIKLGMKRTWTFNACTLSNS